MAARSKTAKYYRRNKKARMRRLKQQRRYQKTKKGKALKKRAYDGMKKLRAKGKGRKGDGKDVCHTKRGLKICSPSKNRARKGIHA